MLNKEKRKLIETAKKYPVKVTKHFKAKHPRPNLTQRVLEGDVVRRKNAHVRKVKGQYIPAEPKKYTVAEVDESNRWFRIEGDTKWHNASDFVLLKKADSDLQKIVKKVLDEARESANASDTDSPEDK